jgi:hypothetical protein
MRLHILSDLHLEFEAFAPPAIEADAIILAGDISTGGNGLKWALKAFPDRAGVSARMDGKGGFAVEGFRTAPT